MRSLHRGQVSRSARWGVVVPVKRLDVAKSRLAVLGDAGRRALALAFAEDVVVAALRCREVERVLVVTDDADAAASLRACGADVTPDLPGAGLDAALDHGCARLRSAVPLLGVAAVSADLPALRGEDLSRVLRAVRRRGVVADAQGTGTTVLAAAPGHPLAPAYGARSLGRHVASGAEQVPAAAGVRRDVDTPEELADALRLGVGGRTAAVAHGLGLLATAGGGVRPAGRGTMHS